MLNLKKRIAGVYHGTLCKALYNLRLFRYRKKTQRKINIIRRKDSIKVLFIVSEVASWKTELLYLSMLKHPRFQPYIGISTSRSPSNVKSILQDYLKLKGYDSIDLDSGSNLIRSINPDIIFYYKPYGVCYSEGHFFNHYLDYIFCGLDYCFSVTKHVVHIEKEYFDYCWMFFTEHDDVANRRKELLGWRANNVRVTGVPMQDILLLPKENFADPWKDKTGKIRIIYAPHHSIPGTNGDGIEFATFLEYGDFILGLAQKYRDSITIAFKPHPNLYMKLVSIWGKERTDEYYATWQRLPNTQFETGEYVGLFKYSDAIIHDSASFIVEYMYMNKPSMYLVSEKNDIDDMFGFVQKAFQLYRHGRTVDDIEQFVQDVIAGTDINKNERSFYITTQLLPPNGKSACDNIMNAILGE